MRGRGVGDGYRQEPPGPEQGDLREWPLSELLKQLSEETTRLVHQEIELAKAELTQKGKPRGLAIHPWPASTGLPIRSA